MKFNFKNMDSNCENGGIVNVSTKSTESSVYNIDCNSDSSNLVTTNVAMKLTPQKLDANLRLSASKKSFLKSKTLHRYLHNRHVRRMTKYSLIGFTIVQLCVFLLCVAVVQKHEQFRLYSKYGSLFTLGLNLCLVNALLTCCFQLYAISTNLIPLILVIGSLQVAYFLLQVLAIMMEHFCIKHLYFALTLLTFLQILLISLFVLMNKKRQTDSATTLTRRNLSTKQLLSSDAHQPTNRFQPLHPLHLHPSSLQWVRFEHEHQPNCQSPQLLQQQPKAFSSPSSC